MAITNKGIYYPNDYSQVADVPEDFKKLAESVDEAIGNIPQYDDSDIRGDISNLQMAQEALTGTVYRDVQELRLLQNNLPDPVTTEQSEEITLQDAMNYYSQLDVSGNSTQATRSGKNKLYLKDVSEQTNGNGITYSVKNGVITLNGTSLRTHYMTFNSSKFDLPAGDYTMSGRALEGSCSGSSGKQLNNEDNSKNLFNGGTMTSTVSKTIESEEVGVHLSLYIGSDAVFNNYKFEIQLEEGTQATEIEKYGAMPSPDFASKIKNCGDNVNLFDDEIEQGNINGETGVNEDNSNRIRSKNYVEIPANTKKIRVIRSVANNEFWLRFYDENKSYLGFLASAATDNNANVLDFNMNQNAKYIRFVDLSNDLNSKIKITTDLGCSGYSPYKCGSVDIKVENSNTFNQANGFKSGGTDRAVVNEDGSITTTSNFSNSRNKGVFVELKKNTNYTVSLDIVSMETSSTNKRGIAEVCLYNEDESFNSGLIANKTILDTDVGTRISFSFNSGDYDKWAVQVSGWYGSGQTGSLTYKNVMVSELTDINFVEHKEKIITFPLKEGQLLHAGDYLTSDGVHHVKQTCVFDGTENVLSAYLDETIDSFRIVTSSKYNQMLSYQTDDKCSHFKNLGHTPAWGRQANTFALSSEGYLYIFFEKNKITSETEAKNWIAEQYNNGTPLTAEGTLEEEYVESYTEEQQAVYNELKNLILYKGYNYITCTDETKCKMKLTYRPDNNVKIKSLEERIAALESEATV